MPYAIRQLISRGYWKPADDGGTGGGGGNGSDDAAAKAAADAAKAASDAAAAEAEAARVKAEGGSGKSKPSDSEAALLKEVMDKKAKITTMNTELEQVKASLKAFEGLDAAAVRALVAEAEQRKTKDLEDKGAWDALKKQMVDAHTSEHGMTKAQLQKAIDDLGAKTAKVADLTVGVSFGQSKFITEDVSTAYSIPKMRTFFGPHFEFDGEKVVGYDKPAGASNRTVLVDSKGDALSFDDALRKLVDADPDRESILKSKTKPGAGSKSEPKGKLPERHVEMTGRDRIAAGLAAQKKS